MKLQRKFLNRPDLRQENGKVTIIVWSPGLVVMGRESRSEGRGFESRHYILDGHFSHIFVVKIVMIFVWKDQNQTKNRQGLAHFYNNNHLGPILLTYLLTYLLRGSITACLTSSLTGLYSTKQVNRKSIILILEPWKSTSWNLVLSGTNAIKIILPLQQDFDVVFKALIVVYICKFTHQDRNGLAGLTWKLTLHLKIMHLNISIILQQLYATKN